MDKQAILTQLGYSVTPSIEAHVTRVIDNTVGFEHIAKHVIALHDALKSHHSFVALSNNKDYFKIKNEAIGAEMVEEVNEIIAKWATKYKVTLEKVPQKDTYYIVGYKS
mgnify:CR=1 FL=1